MINFTRTELLWIDVVIGREIKRTESYLDENPTVFASEMIKHDIECLKSVKEKLQQVINNKDKRIEVR